MLLFFYHVKLEKPFVVYIFSPMSVSIFINAMITLLSRKSSLFHVPYMAAEFLSESNTSKHSPVKVLPLLIISNQILGSFGYLR